MAKAVFRYMQMFPSLTKKITNKVCELFDDNICLAKACYAAEWTRMENILGINFEYHKN